MIRSKTFILKLINDCVRSLENKIKKPVLPAFLSRILYMFENGEKIIRYFPLFSVLNCLYVSIS